MVGITTQAIQKLHIVVGTAMQGRYGLLCFISKLKKKSLVEETEKALPSDAPGSGPECSWAVVVNHWRVGVTPKIRAGQWQAGEPFLGQ